MSGGVNTDTESARLSNVQPYKFNSAARNSNPKALNIRKINPTSVKLKPVSRGSGVGVSLRNQNQTIPVAGAYDTSGN